MAIDIGRIAYQTHSDYVELHNGKPFSKWEEVGKVEQDAWRHAACAVLDYIQKCEEDMNNNVIG